MYTFTQRPNKILTNTRRGDRSISGLSQKLEACNLENQNKRSGELQPEMSSPRPVFHQVNGRRPHFQKSPQEAITPQHEEIIKYIHETWKSVYREYESTKESGSEGKAPNVVYYQDKSTNLMPNFQPFDLENFWGQRLFQNITQST